MAIGCSVRGVAGRCPNWIETDCGMIAANHWEGNMPKSDRAFSIHSPEWTGLAKVIEEAGEVIQVGAKIITAGGRTDWNGSDLAHRLEDELGDLMATINFLIESNSDQISQHAITTRHLDKLTKFRKHGWSGNG